MYTCERCGSGFSPIRIGVAASCPRCRARDGVTVPLTFTLFETASTEVASEVDHGAAEPSATPVEVEQKSE
jgi:hypothetical protein